MIKELKNVFLRLDSLIRSWKLTWTLLVAAIVIINVSQMFATKTLWMGTIIIICTILSVAILPYMKWLLLPSLLESDDYYITIHSLVTFVMIVIGVIPLELLLATDMNLDIIESLGIFTVIGLFDIGGTMLSISTFMLVSMIYWLYLIEIRKESILYIKCKKIKEDIYE